jgi:polycomb protein EED
MDHALMIWYIYDDILDAVKKSEIHDPAYMSSNSKTLSMLPPLSSTTSSSIFPFSFKTRLCQFPYFSNNTLHDNYCDFIRFWGDAVLSKSTSPKIVLWQPIVDFKEYPNSELSRDLSLHPLIPPAKLSSKPPVILRDFAYEDCDVWYVKFAMNVSRTLLAVGNKAGVIFLWSLHPDHWEANKARKIALPVPYQRLIRTLAFSVDSTKLIVTLENGIVIRLDCDELPDCFLPPDISDDDLPTKNGVDSTSTIGTVPWTFY